MVVVSFVFVVYFLFLIAMLIGWRRAITRPIPTTQGKDPMISVVVPVRNEEATIGRLLTDLSAQEYANFEIIIVNDDCEDETLWEVSLHNLPNLSIVHNKGRGKKAALATGIARARGSVIVTTDADCSVQPQWLRCVASIFAEPGVMLAFGAVRMPDGSYFDSLQAIEFSSLIATGAATSAFNTPTLCNGANLAFRKKVFGEVKGYDGNLHVPSGDDEFLMRKIHRRYPKGIRFINHAAAVVTTRTQSSVENLLNQRVRWASKWRYNTAILPKVLAVVVALFQVAFVVNWFLVFSPHIMQALFLFSLKAILESALLLQICYFMGVRWSWRAFFSLQLVYPLYVIGVAAASFFVPFEWKHRTFRPA